jgi:signal transduction histidine kinase
VAQLLTAIKLQLDEVERFLPNAFEAVKAAIARIRQLTAEALSIIRSVSHRLHPPDWQVLTLSAALERLWELSGVPQNFAAELQIDPLPSEPGLHVKTVIYRAAQEALSNLSRHARPTRVRMSLQFEGSDLVLRVSNDGTADASDPELAEKKTWGIGLYSLRDQVQALGGRMQLFRTTNEFTLGVRIPLTGASDDAY